MTAHKKVRLQCDAPGCLASVDTSRALTKHARKRARTWGWSHKDGDGGKDYCPEHTQRAKGDA